MGSLKMTDERIAGVGRSRAWVEVEAEVEVEERTYLRLPKRRWRVELLVQTIFKKAEQKCGWFSRCGNVECSRISRKKI